MKSADRLAGDAILNYKTIQAFGCNEEILEEYGNLVDVPIAEDVKKGHKHGFLYGFSQVATNLVFTALYCAQAYLWKFYPNYKYTQPDRMFAAMFTILYGGFAAANASQWGPDAGKAAKAAARIFMVIDKPPQIDAVNVDEEKVQKLPEVFTGKIEFKGVWFRYPTRLHEWVFKGLDLTIEPNDTIAIVGESGQGKSTFINLVMRFYDPEFGEILIDGVNIKNYDIRELRRSMGLVMQEPTLFNYSIRDNILYGKPKASNLEIREAVQVANAVEFIEGNELEDAFDDDAGSLRQALEHELYSSLIKEALGEEKYESKLKVLKDLEKKEQKQGVFKTQEDMIDHRTEEEKGQDLHIGYNIMCGNRGSKLSGGQKQRIAIARAIIRQPKILLLDEATSALDENSQRKVQAALDKVMTDRTSIVIAHRLTTVEKCNRIAVIEGGKIVEEGRFDDLKTKEDGYFSTLAAGMQKRELKEDKKRMSMMSERQSFMERVKSKAQSEQQQNAIN